MGVIYSRSQELTLVVFPVHILTESHPILSDYIVTVLYAVSFPIYFCSFLAELVSFYNSIQFQLYQSVQS